MDTQKMIEIAIGSFSALMGGAGAWFFWKAKKTTADCDDRVAQIAEELQRARTFDEVTGAFNYQAFSKSAYIQLRLAHRHKWPITLLMIDVKDLERINLKYGYEAGDAVLKALADAIFKSVRTSDVVGRFDGSKFYVVLQECDAENVGTVMERIAHAIEEMPAEVDDKEIPFEYYTVAVSHWGEQAYIKEMMAEAEAELAKAKARGEKFVQIGGKHP
jgi:diguanylate cyclase (GGDEF)-like protein